MDPVRLRNVFNCDGLFILDMFLNNIPVLILSAIPKSPLANLTIAGISGINILGLVVGIAKLIAAIDAIYSKFRFTST